MPTFGRTVIGSGKSVQGGANETRLGKFTLTEDAASVSKLTAYFEGYLQASQKVKGVIYAADGAAGIPGTLKGESAELNVAVLANMPPAWYDLTFAVPFALLAGDYWIGYHWGASINGSQYYRETTGGTSMSKADTYAGGAANPYGAAGTSSALLYSVYATYAAAGGGGGGAGGGPMAVPVAF